MHVFSFSQISVRETSEYSETLFFTLILRLILIADILIDTKKRSVAFFLNVDFKICMKINVI